MREKLNLLCINLVSIDNSLKVQYYLSFGRHYHIYFVFTPTFTCKYKSLQVFSKINSLRVFFSCRKFKLMTKHANMKPREFKGENQLRSGF